MSRILRALQRASKQKAPESTNPRAPDRDTSSPASSPRRSAGTETVKGGTHDSNEARPDASTSHPVVRSPLIPRIVNLAGDLRAILKDGNGRSGRAKKIALVLISASRELRAGDNFSPEIQDLMVDMIQGTLTRAMPSLRREIAFRVYSHLRSKVGKKRFSHGRMFAEMPKLASRLRLLNFLYKNSQRGPAQFTERFERYFDGAKLRYNERRGLFELAEPTR